MKKLGFGFMRLPMAGEMIDIEQTKAMVDRFLAAGFTYFDTAHGYIGEKSEPTLKECLVDRYPRDRYASYAIRFAASFPKVFMVLSGMSTLAQVEDNVSFMEDFKPLNEKEVAAVEKVREMIRKQDSIACTACAYCVDGCPKKIPIPGIFSLCNTKKRYHNWNGKDWYAMRTEGKGKASDCIGCGKCEKVCPQHLSIREELKKAAEVFEG